MTNYNSIHTGLEIDTAVTKVDEVFVNQHSYTSVIQDQIIDVPTINDSTLTRVVQVYEKIGDPIVVDTSLDFDTIDESDYIQEDATNGTDFIDDIVQLYNSIISLDSYDKIYHIDAISGLDTNDGLTFATAFKTLTHIWSLIDTTSTYGIYMYDGNYDFVVASQQTPNTANINLIGNKNTILMKAAAFYSGVGTNPNSTNFNLYNLVWDGTNDTTGPNANGLNKTWTWNNCAFINIPNNDYGYFWPVQNGVLVFNNCCKPSVSTNFLRLTSGTGSCTNCYGSFDAGYLTVEADFDTATNVFTATPNVDASYNILDAEGTWKNVGTGVDGDDSTQADIGVYGGLYTWRLDYGFPIYTDVQPYYITTSDVNQLNLKLREITDISSVTITNTQPANTLIKSLVSFDGRTTWSKWNGSVWVDASVTDLNTFNFTANGNTIAEIQTGLTNLNITTETYIDFVFDLSTINSSLTPNIDLITINYIEIGSYTKAIETDYSISLLDATTTRIKKLSAGIDNIKVNVIY